MCKFCGLEHCKLMKEQAVRHGPIIEDNVEWPIRIETEDNPTTYSFKDMPPFYSLSALIPDEDEENPHAYIRFVFDEDEECGEGWEEREIQSPLDWQTEKAFLEKIEQLETK